jgi:hypothetical protein
MAMSTMCSLRCKGTSRWMPLALATVLAGTSCGSRRSTGNATDGGPSPDAVSMPTLDSDSRSTVPDAVPMPMVDLAEDLSPRCCSEGVQLGPVGPDAPCSFVMPEEPPSEYNSRFYIYLNRDLVLPNTVDGGAGYSYDPTTLTVTFTGALCDTLTSSPQDCAVIMLCSCHGPCPSWDWCP